MLVKCIENNFYKISLKKGELYQVYSIENGFYRIVDETLVDSLYSKDLFEVVIPTTKKLNSDTPVRPIILDDPTEEELKQLYDCEYVRYLKIQDFREEI